MDNDLDLFDVIKLMNRRKGKFSKLLLADIAEEFESHGYNATDLQYSDEFYLRVRKLILDYINDYTRSISRILLGNEIEG